MSEWITCEAARKAGRQLRGEHDAIAVGSNTVVTDNPQLTTRLAHLSDPIRVVFDSNLRILAESNLVQTAKSTPLWLICREDTSEKAKALMQMGVVLLPVTYDQSLSVLEALEVLFHRNVKSLLLEGGGTLTASFLEAGVIDRIEWFRAPIILGGDSRNGIGDLGLENLNLAHTFKRTNICEVGVDIHESYERIV